MSVFRINEFRAKEGHAESLRSYLARVIPMIASSTGCQSCRLLQSSEQPMRFVVLEIWDSAESHQSAVKNIPQEMFAEVMALVEGTPVGGYFHD